MFEEIIEGSDFAVPTLFLIMVMCSQVESSKCRIRAGTGLEVVGKSLETVVSGPEMTRESPEATGSVQPDSRRK